jgi:hypothetical protein
MKLIFAVRLAQPSQEIADRLAEIHMGEFRFRHEEAHIDIWGGSTEITGVEAGTYSPSRK